MDAFAISVANGLTLKNFNIRHALWMALYFGGFQFLMPLLGALLAGTVAGYMIRLGPFISFALLGYVGVKMILDAVKPGGEDAALDSLSHPRLLALAVATSIDALAVGVSFAFLEDVKLLPSCILIGCTTALISFGGAMLGSKIPGVSGKRAGIVGGLVLIAIGLKILIQGVFLK